MASTVAVVIPVLDEPGIAAFVAAVREALRGAEWQCDIVLVNDGKPVAVDGARVVQGGGRGKGRAVRDGILATNAGTVIVIDADLDVLIPRLPEFVALVTTGGYDVAIAERDADFHARSPVRFVLSFGLLLFQRLIVFNSFRFLDTQCGLKAYRGDIARQLASLQHVDGGMYDIEHLYIAVKNGLRIAQVRVGAVAELRPSRIHLLRCMRTDPAALLAVKWRGLTRRYALRSR